MIIWGIILRHSIDIHHCSVAEWTPDLVDTDWISQDFIPTVQQRGAAIIKARGPKVASAAIVIEHMRDWFLVQMVR